MKNLTITIMIHFLCLFFLPNLYLHAQTNIKVIDIEHIAKQLPESKIFKTKIDSLLHEYNGYIDSLEVDLWKQIDDFFHYQCPSKQALDIFQDEISYKELRILEQENKIDNVLEVIKLNCRKYLQTEISKSISLYADLLEEKFDLVVSIDQTLYFEQQLDITKGVIMILKQHRNKNKSKDNVNKYFTQQLNLFDDINVKEHLKQMPSDINIIRVRMRIEELKKEKDN